jgi:hypothetical protein
MGVCEKTYLIDVYTSHTPVEGAHSPSWPKELNVGIIVIIDCETKP